MKHKKEKSKSVVKYHGYKVKIETYCDESYHDGEEFGSWHESYSNHLKSMISHDDKYPDVTSIHDIEIGQSALVVWIEWSGGDSFGHADRKYTEVIGLFRDIESAKSLQQQIESWKPNDKAKKFEDQYSYHFKTKDGQEFKSGFAPWSGYFESLDSVHVDMVTVF